VLQEAIFGAEIAHKCVGGRGSSPDPAGGACSSPADLLARLRVLHLKGNGRSTIGEKVTPLLTRTVLVHFRLVFRVLANVGSVVACDFDVWL